MSCRRPSPGGAAKLLVVLNFYTRLLLLLPFPLAFFLFAVAATLGLRALGFASLLVTLATPLALLGAFFLFTSLPFAFPALLPTLALFVCAEFNA